MYRLLPIVLAKRALTVLKAVLDFCQKSAKIMLIFLKSARGLHKNAHFFGVFVKHRIFHFSDFQLHFSTTKCSLTITVFLSISPTQRLRFSINCPAYY